MNSVRENFDSQRLEEAEAAKEAKQYAQQAAIDIAQAKKYENDIPYSDPQALGIHMKAREAHSRASKKYKKPKQLFPTKTKLLKSVQRRIKANGGKMELCDYLCFALMHNISIKTMKILTHIDYLIRVKGDGKTIVASAVYIANGVTSSVVGKKGYELKNKPLDGHVNKCGVHSKTVYRLLKNGQGILTVTTPRKRTIINATGGEERWNDKNEIALTELGQQAVEIYRMMGFEKFMFLKPKKNECNKRRTARYRSMVKGFNKRQKLMCKLFNKAGGNLNAFMNSVKRFYAHLMCGCYEHVRGKFVHTKRSIRYKQKQFLRNKKVIERFYARVVVELCQMLT